MKKIKLLDILIAVLLISIFAYGLLSDVMCSRKPPPFSYTKAIMWETAANIQTYVRHYGVVSLSNNVEITSALIAKYREGRLLSLDIEAQRPNIINNGRMIDGWGTPFFFNINSENKTMHIRSFGANRKDDNGNVDDIDLVFEYDGTDVEEPGL